MHSIGLAPSGREYGCGVADLAYPTHWEADVVLRDGRPCRLRPIRSDDRQRLVTFHGSLSAQSIYYRYFAPYPTLTERDLNRFTNVDYVDRMAFVALKNDDIVGVGRYDRTNPDEAEVAFIIRDDQQGKGLGSVLLEHLAAVARERGIARFVAEVLPDNRRMLATFDEAGYKPRRTYDEGVVHLEFSIEPTSASRAVAQAREQRAEARSIHELLNPQRVAVIGASRTPGRLGHEVLRHLVQDGFTGDVVAIHPHATEILGVRAYPSVTAVGEPVDLAIVAVPVESVSAVVEDCAAAHVRGLAVITGGFAETGEQGLQRQRELVRTARSAGIRVLGPHCFGLINTDPNVKLNASVAHAMPPRGRVGFFCQSGALANSMLQGVADRGIGLSSFVSAGNRADVSGNDLLQYWQDDEHTDVVMLYLESLGNPRKFARIAKRLSQRKPTVVVRTGRQTQAIPAGHVIRRTTLPAQALDALFAQAGLLQAHSMSEMLDIAMVLNAPLPAGSRIGLLSNSSALITLTTETLSAYDVDVAVSTTLSPGSSAEVIVSAAQEMLDSELIDHLLLVHMPELVVESSHHEGIITHSLRGARIPVTAVFMERRSSALRDGIACFATVEDASRALTRVHEYVQWRRIQAQADDAVLDVDVEEARAYVLPLVTDTPRQATPEEIATLFDFYGLTVSSPRLAHKAQRLGARAAHVSGIEDPLFGPVMEFGLADPLATLIGDRAYRLAPLDRHDVREFIAAPAAAPLLEGLTLTGLEDFIIRVSHLITDIPQVSALRCPSVWVGDMGVVCAEVDMTLAQPVLGADVRRLNA